MLKRSILFVTIMLATVGTQAVHAQTDEKKPGIAELIFEIRGELIKSEKMMKDAGRDPLFITKKLDLELSFVVEKSTSGEGGLNIGIITLGAGGDYSAASTQKIRLQLETATPPIAPVSYGELGERIKIYMDKYGVTGAFHYEDPRGSA